MVLLYEITRIQNRQIKYFVIYVHNASILIVLDNRY